MRIAQVILPAASQYERKSQRADRAALAERHEVVDDPGNADVAHVYTTGELPRAPFVNFPVPYVAPARVARSRWSFRKPKEPGYVVTWENLPEVVEDRYFSAPRGDRDRGREERVVGSFRRPSTQNMVEQTLARIQRFRNDVQWHLFDAPPTPENLAGVDVWIDPAVSEDDWDGFTAEALVLSLPVVAARTAINAARLEKGRTGWLVPPRDPNEMTHAILSALFKSEVAQTKIEAAKQTASKFRSRQRLRVLTQLYETLI